MCFHCVALHPLMCIFAHCLKMKNTFFEMSDIYNIIPMGLTEKYITNIMEEESLLFFNHRFPFVTYKNRRSARQSQIARFTWPTWDPPGSCWEPYGFSGFLQQATYEPYCNVYWNQVPLLLQYGAGVARFSGRHKL